SLSAAVVPTFTLIYKLFGPIYPGTFDSDTKVYSLNYPGISFLFPLADSFLPLKPTELPFAGSDGTTPVLARIQIYNGPSWNEALPRSLDPLDTYFEPVLIRRSMGIEFTNRKLLLSLNSHTQDVLCDLGSPDFVYNKEKDKMDIHKSASAVRGYSSIIYGDDYIWNYFDLGIDVVFDGTFHVVKKIILHTNAMGHHSMMHYAKCNFTLESDRESTGNSSAPGQNGKGDKKGSKEKHTPISHSSHWNQVKKTLGEPLGPPVIFDREDNPFGYTSFFGYDGLLFEVGLGAHGQVMKNNYLATVCIFCE
ncbi:hypothetical protein HDU91_003497, partial [Kappamyces sp. JEL0680]